MAVKEVTTPSVPSGTFAALEIPDFRRFWAGTMVSNMGTWMQSVAQGWLVLQITNSPFMLGLVGFANTIPAVFLTLIGGVAADRYDRRKLCFAGQATSMVAAFVLAVLVSTGWVQPWHIVVLALVNGAAWAMSGSSFQSLIGDLAGRELRANAIALNSMQFHLSRSIGPSIAGIVLAHYGAAICFYGNGISYLFILYAILVMAAPALRPAAVHGPWTQLKAGIGYTVSNRVFVGLLLHTLAVSGLGMPIINQMPVIARDMLHVGATGLGYLMAASGLGSVCGALFVARVSRSRWRGPRVLAMGLLYGAALVALSQVKGPGMAMAMLGLAGAASVSSQATVNGLLQTLADEEMRGRVMSMYNLAFVAASPLGNLMCGWMAQHYGPATAIAVLGGLMMVAIGSVAIFLAPVRRID